MQVGRSWLMRPIAAIGPPILFELLSEAITVVM